ncbi:MAG: beta-lactamase family protein [Saprospiraceae bacterium]|nr:beta-lactamase family protein [Saprospiraceae bacterium]
MEVIFFGSQPAILDQAQWISSLYCEQLPFTTVTRSRLHVYFITNAHEVDTINPSRGENASHILCFVGTTPKDVEWSDAIIYLEDQDPTEISRTVQSVFGGSYFYERLSRSVGQFPFGSGLMTEEVTRLSVPDLQRSHYYQPLRDTMQKLIQEGLDSFAFPGAQLLVLHDGEIAVMSSYGFHTYEKARPVTNTDLYDMASITKVTTATPALMHLYDQKKIDLDKSLCTYFPVLCNSNKADVSLREVLAHQGRLQPYIVYWQNTLRKSGKYRSRTFKKRMSSRFPIKITEELFLHRKYKRKIDKAIVNSPLNENPGYIYSGLTFLLFPELVKELTGERIDSFLYKYFYHPLGAQRLTYRPNDHFAMNEIIPTEVDTVFRRQLVHGYVHDEAAAMLDGLSTNAGLFGNALDLGKLCQMLLNSGSYGGEQFISPETLQEFTRYQFPEQGNRRGLGFDKPLLEYKEGASYVARSASPESYGHSGFTGTFFWVDPQNKTVFILLTNRVYPTRANTKLYRMGLRPRLHQAIYDFLDQ